MDNTEKKISAAVAAVMAYIKTEEEAVVLAGAAGQAPAGTGPKPLAPMNLWGVSGRQAMMNMRNLMQMKTFHR